MHDLGQVDPGPRALSRVEPAPHTSDEGGEGVGVGRLLEVALPRNRIGIRSGARVFGCHPAPAGELAQPYLPVLATDDAGLAGDAFPPGGVGSFAVPVDRGVGHERHDGIAAEVQRGQRQQPAKGPAQDALARRPYAPAVDGDTGCREVLGEQPGVGVS